MQQAYILQSEDLETLISRAVTKAIINNTGISLHPSATAQLENSDLLTLNQAVKFLHTSKPTFIALRKSGAFKAHPIGNRHLFSKAELEAFVKSKTVVA